MKSEQWNLRSMAADGEKKQAQAQLPQVSLVQDNGRELALVADFDQRVARIDRQSRALLSQISDLNSQIVARRLRGRR